MKILSLFLLLSLSFLASTPLSAQVNCTTYSGGETSCDGPRGHHAEGRQYFGGVEGWYYNRGNTATVRHHPFGVTSIDTIRPPISTYAPSIVIPQAASSGRGFGGVNGDPRVLLQTSPTPEVGYVYAYPQPVPDKSKLPKTPEEYRLTFLLIKAVKEKDFQRADALERLIWEERFANSSATERTEMLRKARTAEALEAEAAMDRLEKRIRAGGNATELASFIKFKEMAKTAVSKKD